MQPNQPKLISLTKPPRANRSNAQINDLVEAFKAGSLTMTEFCHRNQLALSTFSKWVNSRAGSVKTFKPIMVAQPPKLAPERLSQQLLTLEFKGVMKLTFSNQATPAFILDIIKGLPQ
jgi:hypothetical protein